MVAKDRSLLGLQPFQFSAAVFNPFQSRLQPLLHLELYGGGKVLMRLFLHYSPGYLRCRGPRGRGEWGGWTTTLNSYKASFIFCCENPAKDSLPSLGHCSS